MSKLLVLLAFVFVGQFAHAQALCERYRCVAIGAGGLSGTSKIEYGYGNSLVETQNKAVTSCYRSGGGWCQISSCEQYHGPSFSLFGDACVDAWTHRHH